MKMSSIIQFSCRRCDHPGQLYLISPQEVCGNFPDRLKAALAGGPVAAFQLRVKGSTSMSWRRAEPL
jgi:thiamine-phosphate pyrophosphorylase